MRTLNGLALAFALCACAPTGPELGDAGDDAGEAVDDAGAVEPDAGAACTAECPPVDNGVNRCVGDTCVLECNERYDECEDRPGVCTDVTFSRDDCGGCGERVPPSASDCFQGEPVCGDRPPCSDPDAPFCGQVSGSFDAYFCHECAEDAHCADEEFCCNGGCRPVGDACDA